MSSFISSFDKQAMSVNKIVFDQLPEPIQNTGASFLSGT
jgi:hypothetical protein